MINFSIFNKEEIFDKLLELKDNTHLYFKEINLMSSINNTNFPIESIDINIALNQNNNNKASMLAIIKKNTLTANKFIFESDNKIFSIRNIENFGIYIFSGRPDLEINNKFSDFINIKDRKSFLNCLNNLEEIINLALIKIYEDNKIKSNLTIEINYSNKIKITNVSKKEVKEIPASLKRMYEKLNYNE